MLQSRVIKLQDYSRIDRWRMWVIPPPILLIAFSCPNIRAQFDIPAQLGCIQSQPLAQIDAKNFRTSGEFICRSHNIKPWLFQRFLTWHWELWSHAPLFSDCPISFVERTESSWWCFDFKVIIIFAKPFLDFGDDFSTNNNPSKPF